MAKWEEAPIVEPEQRPAWEQAPITHASFGERAVGAVARGEMAVGQAILSAPAMAVKQYGLVRQADMANAVLKEPDPERQAILRGQMADSEQAFDKVANWLNKPAELHRVGRKIIEQNHPEWASDPPKNFVDLITNPDKLGIAVAESAPILVNAGILTLAGQPQLATALMYVAEGQQAYDQAIQDGASEDDAAVAYAIYGSVSAALEKMQLEGLLKIGKGSYNALLNRTVQKVAGRGLGHATWDVIKVAAQEGLEEMSQGAWQEITAKLVYDKSVPDGVAGFVDRRAQEAYLGFMIGLIPGAAGGAVGAIKGRGQAQEPGMVAPEGIELRHYTDVKLPEGVPTKGDTNNLVWFTEGESYLKGENYVKVNIPKDKLLRLDEPEIFKEYIAEYDTASKTNAIKFAESRGYLAVKVGNDVSMRPETAKQLAPTEPTPAPDVAQAGITPVEGVEIPPVSVEDVVTFKPVKDPLGGFSYGHTLYNLPPVKEDMIRLYRAETGVRTKTVQGDIEDFGQDDKGTGGWFTTDFGYALNFYEGAYGKVTADRKMSYMDVSEQSAKEHFQGNIEGTKDEYFYPELRQPETPTEPTTEKPETLAGAAIRLKSGEMLTGTTHANILRGVEAEGRTIANEEFDIPAGSGFVTDTGRFLSPEEAWKVADKAGQIKKDEIAKELVDKKYLIAEGVDFAEIEKPVVEEFFHGTSVESVEKIKAEGFKFGKRENEVSISKDKSVAEFHAKKTGQKKPSILSISLSEDVKIFTTKDIPPELQEGFVSQTMLDTYARQNGFDGIDLAQLEEDGIIRVAKGKEGEVKIFHPEVLQLTPVPTKPPWMSRRKLLKLGHDLPKKLGWDEAKRRDFMQQTVGKPSMKGMTPKEMKALVTALQGEAREAGVLPPEGYQKTMFIGTREVKTDEFFDRVLAEVDKLKGRAKQKPRVITRRGQRRKRGLLKTTKAIGVGIDNLNIPHLFRKIGGTTDGVLKEVGVTNYRRSIHRISSVFRGGADQLNTALDKAGVTPNDLAEMSQQLDPRLTLIRRGRELVGKPKTKQHTVELNGKQFSLSMAELLDIYLSAQQEEGLGHIEKAGLKIFGEKTGAITKEQLQPLLDLVEANPKAKAFADAVVKISDEYNAPQLNYTHSRVNPEAPEKLADKENYWHLNVDRPLRIKGKGTYSISLLENKNILRPRKGPKGALIVGDAFSKFFSVQYAVAEYVGMAEELRLLNMVLNYEPVMNELKSKGYGDIRSNIKQLIEWAQDSKSTTTSSDKLVSKILHGAYRAVLHFSPEVILSQYMSTGHYAGVVDPKYVPLLSVPPTKSLIKEMLEHNSVVWTRYYAGGQNAELAEAGQLDASLRLLTGKRADLNKTGIAAGLTDLAAFGQGWKLAKAVVDDTTQLKKGSLEYWDAVSDKAEELWDTQPSWDKWNKSVNTSQRGIKRLPFLFRSYFEKSLMMLSTANETYKASEKTTADKAKWAQVYGAIIGSQMATALIRTFIGHVLWRKRKSVWDYVGAMVAAPLVMVSVVGGYMNRVVGNVFRILAGEKQKFQGEPISNLATDTLEKFFLGIGQTTKAAAFYLAGEGGKAEVQIKAATRNFVISIGTMKGVPVRQIEKIGKAVESEDVPKYSGGYID